MFSRSMCGEGVPNFYTPEDLDHECPDTWIAKVYKWLGECHSFSSYDVPLGDDGLPIASECSKHSFAEMYTMPEVASAFDALYSNKDGLMDKMMDFWSIVAERYS